MMPNIAIWSIFRNDGKNGVDRYRGMVNAFEYPQDNLRFYLCEGDSIDDTYDKLIEWALEDKRVRVVKKDSGLPYHGHVVNIERFACLQSASNTAIERLVSDERACPWADFGMLIESDIGVPPTAPLDLIEGRPEDCGVIAPMVWIEHGVLRFYDTWAFRFENGNGFPPVGPSWYETNMPSGPYRVMSVGSVVLFEIDLIMNGARYTPNEVIVGMVKSVFGMGRKVYVHPRVNVMHPKIGSVEQGQGR